MTAPRDHREAADTQPRSARRESWVTPLAAAFALGGIGLRVYQFLQDRSLHIDEAALALNIRDRTFAGLLAPLDYGQTAPIGYLWVQKAVMLAFGESEFVLRAFPLAAGIAAVVLFAYLARRVLPSHLLAPAIAIFAFGRYSIYWASDLKPYSIDL
ncbi:MAG: hypothetical protein PVH00_05960, partial [Gemmatimonadota bacterium]